jgi:hypothetical protein
MQLFIAQQVVRQLQTFMHFSLIRRRLRGNAEDLRGAEGFDFREGIAEGTGLRGTTTGAGN